MVVSVLSLIQSKIQNLHYKVIFQKVILSVTMNERRKELHV